MSSGKRSRERGLCAWTDSRKEQAKIYNELADGYTYALNKYHFGTRLDNEEAERGPEKGETIFGWSIREINLRMEGRLDGWGKGTQDRSPCKFSLVSWRKLGGNENEKKEGY